MGQRFRETAIWNSNQKLYEEGWERIFGKKDCEHCKGVSMEIKDATCGQCGRKLLASSEQPDPLE